MIFIRFRLTCQTHNPKLDNFIKKIKLNIKIIFLLI